MHHFLFVLLCPCQVHISFGGTFHDVDERIASNECKEGLKEFRKKEHVTFNLAITTTNNLYHAADNITDKLLFAL